MRNKTITSEIVVAYSQCPRKAFLLLCTKEQGVLVYLRLLSKTASRGIIIWQKEPSGILQCKGRYQDISLNPLRLIICQCLGLHKHAGSKVNHCSNSLCLARKISTRLRRQDLSRVQYHLIHLTDSRNRK
jgi:hypothetical protein